VLVTDEQEGPESDAIRALTSARMAKGWRVWSKRGKHSSFLLDGKESPASELVGAIYLQSRPQRIAYVAHDGLYKYSSSWMGLQARCMGCPAVPSSVRTANASPMLPSARIRIAVVDAEESVQELDFGDPSYQQTL